MRKSYREFRSEFTEHTQILEAEYKDRYRTIWTNNRIGYKKSGISISSIIDREKMVELARCAEDPFYFIYNYLWIEAREKNAESGRVWPFNLRKYQHEQVNLYLNHNKVALLYPRRSGKTSGTVAYFIWRMLFEDNFKIMCFANKDKTAKNVVKEVKTLFKYLPLWMQPGVEKMNEHEFTFENGSSISAVATTEDAGRSEGANIVYLDECVTGDTKITVRNTETKEIKKIEIGELYERSSFNEKVISQYSDEIYKNNDYQVLTADGFCDFFGIKKTEHETSIELKFSNNTILECSENHKIYTDEGYKYAKDLFVGDCVYDDELNDVEVVEKNVKCDDVDLFDLIHVDNQNHNYITNGVVSSNCAFVDKNLFDEFYTALVGTMTDATQLIATSTPNGLNHWWKIIREASETDEHGRITKQGTNSYVKKQIKWNEVPKGADPTILRDEKFKQSMIQTFGGGEIGMQKWLQEYEAEFIGSGGTLLDTSILKGFAPIVPNETKMILEKFELRIYEHPQENHRYLLTHDPSSGHGGENDDFTGIHVWDVTDPYHISQSAVIYDKNIDILSAPFVLNEVGRYYNYAFEISERNKFESIVQYLFVELDYDNMYIDEQGFYGLHNTEVSRNLALSTMKSLFKDEKILVNDYDLVHELSVFVKKGSKYQADTGEHDDLVMSLALMCWLMATPERFERYFPDDIDYIKDYRKIAYNEKYMDIVFDNGEETDIFTPDEVEDYHNINTRSRFVDDEGDDGDWF